MNGVVADLLDALAPRSCAACEGPSAGTLCERCQESVVAPDVLGCALFGGAVADAVRAAKFRPDATVAEALARLWVERVVSGLCPALPIVDAVAFVPAPYRRRLARGFDLPAVLAGAVAGLARAPLVDALACTRADAPLSFGADKAARAAAVSGRYRVRPAFAARAAGCRVLLVDDVKTTGATLAEAARALADSGADVVTAAFAIAP